MKKKVVAVLLVGAMAGTMLAGCGGDSKAADAGDDTKKEDTADTSDDSDEGSAEGKVTLNVTTTFAGTESNVDKYQETIENWQKETGNKINDSSASADEAMKARVITDFLVHIHAFPVSVERNRIFYTVYRGCRDQVIIHI